MRRKSTDRTKSPYHLRIHDADGGISHRSFCTAFEQIDAAVNYKCTARKVEEGFSQGGPEKVAKWVGV